MIDSERYNLLKDKYGHCSSWAIWAEPTSEISKNVDDMSIFNDEDLCTKLNDKYVFVGLNASDTHGDQGDEPWKNFHSDYEHQKDYKLRHALTGTKFWGSYITDIIKVWAGNREKSKEANSKEFMSELKKHPDIVEENIKIFKKELSILTDEKPILIAMGWDSFKILKKNMREYNPIRIRHYSDYISPENYKQEVQDTLKDI